MIKQVLTIAFVASLALTSCTKEPVKDTDIVVVDSTDNNVPMKTYTSADGKTIEVSFDNNKDIATIIVDGETIVLEGQKPASGIWYKNDVYELKGKGEEFQLTKDGTAIFDHKDPSASGTLKDVDGNTLHMDFNKETNEASVVLNDGEAIILKGQEGASGIHYKNDNYELIGEPNELEFKKDGKAIFSYTDIVKKSLKDSKGNTVDISINNETNEAIINLNGGDAVALDGQEVGSGMLYKNKNYELSGKGDKYELKYDGDVVFKN